ncbi:DUF4240 domain-containing protein [Actinomadura rubrisoli]|uniref:DUF4240 domain-containing protein n=1 Tax=Actinomadura rubrisoli TaxID=2530368 RepID=A0A4R5BCW8_9ACTN|nr:DUF4240 domain-containing protein [Actinomadura rubrisoli]TDD83395.1 DUF4240 domain-containing protein [Actinomadura rubrisoli]
MDEDAFWELIERSRRHSPGPGARLAWLGDALAQRPLGEIADFQVRQDELRLRSDTNALWGAAYQILDGLCSMDGFWYFQPWLIGLGRDVFERVTADPDTLAELPAVQRLAWRPTQDWSDDEWPGWEGFNHLAAEAHERLTGTEGSLHEALEARGHDTPHDTAPRDPGWDFEDAAELARRLPRLSTLFPLSAREERDQRDRAAFESLLAERGQTEEQFLAELGVQWLA